MTLRAQMRKTSSGPSPEALLSQLSSYSRGETQSQDGGRSEASRVLGEKLWLHSEVFDCGLICLNAIYMAVMFRDPPKVVKIRSLFQMKTVLVRRSRDL